MANISVKDSAGATKYVKAAGAGTDIDPFVIDRSNTDLLARVGEVQASPTANTLLDRLKALLTGIVLAAGSNNIGIVTPHAPAANFVSGTTAAITDTTRTAVIAAQGVGVSIYVTSLFVSNSHATVGTLVKVESGTTTIFQAYADTLGGGFALTFPVPLVVAANTALNVSCVTTGTNVIANAVGYKL